MTGPTMLDLCDDLTKLNLGIEALYAALEGEAERGPLCWLADRVSDMAKDAKDKANAIRVNGAAAGGGAA